MKLRLLGCLLLGLGAATQARADSGTEGASFLEIPVGARPAGMGGAYASLATDAYAPTVNPAGLGFMHGLQIATMHLAYLQSMSYEFASLGIPMGRGHALGLSVQYFRPGSIQATDATGAPAGEFTGYYAAYGLSYGVAMGDNFSIGVTGKAIRARISDVTAKAFAADVGAMLRVADGFSVAAVVANMGQKLSFINQEDQLPTTARLAASVEPAQSLTLSGQVERGLATEATSFGGGVEWRPASILALRAGYNSSAIKGVGGTRGWTAGGGLKLFGQNFDYAWVPFGDLGNTQYFSIVLNFGGDGQ